MVSWVAKAVVQKGISTLPGKHRVNRLFQRHVTHGLTLSDELFAQKIGFVHRHLQSFDRFATGQRGSALEVGTGWFPIVPLALRLAGFGRVVTVDLSPLLSADAVRQTASRLLRAADDGQLSAAPGAVDVNARDALRELVAAPAAEPPTELLARAGVEVVVGDARATGLPSGSVDLINSNNTFEHIPAAVLPDIVGEFARILAPTGIMSHHVDMSDHFAHRDGSITHFNFLRFSDRTWRLIDNSVQPQNRLRRSDHETMFTRHGLSICARHDWLAAEHELRSVRLHPSFDRYSFDELLVTHTMIVAGPSAGRPGTPPAVSVDRETMQAGAHLSRRG